MKSESLTSLIIAKNLLDKARDMCAVDNAHIASAGLVVLQDSLELIFIASLLELGVDERKPLESLSFDQLIGELKQIGFKIPKSATIKALNKARVVVKHYGQLGEPTAVRNYLVAANACIEEVITQVFGKRIEEIWLHQFIENEETKTFFEACINYLEKGEYFNALVEIRKALFAEIESDYSVVEWKDISTSDKSKLGFFEMAVKGGDKAPYWKKNKEWIEKNVREPFDYIQLDHQEVRNDLLEWGVNTQDFWNLWRLTPTVFREKKESKWVVKGEPKYYLEGATEENVKYCLDKAIGLIVKKQSHFDLFRSLKGKPANDTEVMTVSSPTNVYEKASSKATMRETLEPGLKLRVNAFVEGLDREGKYFDIFQFFEKEKKLVFGYVKLEDVEIVKDK